MRRLGRLRDASQVASAFAQALQPLINAEANTIQYGQNSPYAPSPYVVTPNAAQQAAQTQLTAKATASAATWAIGGVVALGALWLLTRGSRLR